MSTGEKYWIRDGVRRAKAAEKLGHHEISAEVWENDVPIRSQSVPIDQLYTDKPAIETPGTEYARWHRILGAVRRGTFDDGTSVPSIIVEERSRGIP